MLIEDAETKPFKADIRQGVARAQDKMYKALDRNVDKFELYIVRNILKVPKHLDTTAVVAPIYSSNTTHTMEEEEDLDKVRLC